MRDTSAGSPSPRRYEIRIKGRLAARWAAWFDGMSLTVDSDGTTVLEGPVVDQAALHGLLQRVRDLGVPLLSVSQLNVTQPDTGQPTGTPPNPDNASTGD